MSGRAPRATHLKDYQQPDYFISQVELHFNLFEDRARVSTKLSVTRHREGLAGDKTPLKLDGENLKLVTVALNGKLLKKGTYQVTPTELVIPNVPDRFTLEIKNDIEPHKNKALEGLYKSGNIFCTQNEPQGFRKITYFLDRPDVMAKFKTTVVADHNKYPVLLSNGNPVGSGKVEGGRHFVTWEDPFPKPAYLFALVAGRLGLVEDTYQTNSGRTICLKMYVDPGNESRCDYAMGALKRAMKWDEDTFGLECDLETYMVVGVDAFNMGAMENKGLNIFNSQYILADPTTATDQNYEAIEGVIGHEYFHNWTGNRVTCRDWFQITLKEGLTIFRDQEFSADMTSRPVNRISNVRVLRDHQFVEDAGPNAHPIRPESYIEINNFYTVTVYEKGAEVIRMIYTLIGKDAFRRGMDKYFELFDGKAVTTNDFVFAMEQGSGMNLEQFKRWYGQRGTPICRVRLDYDASKRQALVTVEQKPPQTANANETELYLFPLSVGFLDSEGRDLFANQVLHISKEKETFTFNDVPARPIPSLLRDFSAPVVLEYDYSSEELIFLLAHDSDAFNRYDAGQRIAMISLRELIVAHQAKKTLSIDPTVLEAFGALILDPALDPAFKAECLILPSITRLTEGMEICDFDAADYAREFMIRSLAQAHEDAFRQLFETFSTKEPYAVTPEAIGKRTLKNRALAFLVSLERPEHTALAFQQLMSATNMTDELAALGVLCQVDTPERKRAIGHFYEKWHTNTLVMNKWFAVQAGSKLKNVLVDVKALEKDPAYDAKNPNKIRSLVGVFAHNVVQFHEASGAGYHFMAEKILEVDQFNPIVASRLAEAFKKYAKLDPKRKKVMGGELQKILNTKKLSRDVYEIVSKTLGKS